MSLRKHCIITTLLTLLLSVSSAWGATYCVRQDGTNPIYSFTGAADSSGLIQLTRNAHTFTTGDVLTIYGVVGTNGLDTASTGTWTITKNGTNTITLNGSSFPSGAEYTSGGKGVYPSSDPTVTARAFNVANFNLFSPNLKPDDIVNLSSLGGDFTSAIAFTTASGTSGHPIVIQPFTGDTAVKVSVTAGSGAISVTGTASYLSITGPIELVNTAQTGLKLIDVSNSTVTGITAHGCASYGILLIGGSGNSIYSNTAYTNTYPGIAVIGSAAVNADNNTIYSNTVYDNGDSGIKISENNATGVHDATNLHGNVVRNNTAYSNGSGIYVKLALTTSVYSNTTYTNTRAGGEGYGIASQSSTGTSIYQNTIYSNKSHGIENWGSDSDPGSGEYGPSDNVTIYRNIVYDHHYGDGVTSIGIKARKDAIDGTKIWSNIVYDNDIGIGLGDDAPGILTYNNTLSGNNYGVHIMAHPLGLKTGSGVTLKNNLVSASVNNALYTEDNNASLEAHTNNLYYQASGNAISYNGTTYTTAQVTNFEATAIAADPLLDSDLRPPANSPAIDHGDATICASYPTDYAGRNQLRYGRGCEIGAYAFPASGMGGM